jgi:hypothetical protein
VSAVPKAATKKLLGTKKISEHLVRSGIKVVVVLEKSGLFMKKPEACEAASGLRQGDQFSTEPMTGAPIRTGILLPIVVTQTL